MIKANVKIEVSICTLVLANKKAVTKYADDAGVYQKTDLNVVYHVSLT